jgi:hypothetical protein
MTILAILTTAGCPAMAETICGMEVDGQENSLVMKYEVYKVGGKRVKAQSCVIRLTSFELFILRQVNRSAA